MTKSFNAIEIANRLAIQHLTRSYLAPRARLIWTIADACITAKQTWNRSGVPADAETYLYRIEHPDQGWSLDFRAVWRLGDLMKPAVHLVIEGVYDDGDHGDEALPVLINEWLRSL